MACLMLMLRSSRVCAAGATKVNPQPVLASYFEVKAAGTHSPDAARSRLAERAVEDDRLEPGFSAINDNAEYEAASGSLLDQHAILTG